MSINRVIISGNMTRDAELRQTQSGMAVLSFGVAVNDRRKNPQTQEWEDHANFVDCTLFGQRAQAIAPYLLRGVKVALEGKLRYSSWENQEGQKRSKLEVIVDDIEFMSRRDDYDAPQGQQMPQQRPQAVPQQRQQRPSRQQPQAPAYGGYGQGYSQPQDVAATVYDEDIPF